MIPFVLSMFFLKRGSARCFGFLFCFFLPSGYKPPPQPRARSTFSFYHHPHHLAGTTRRGGHLDCIYKQGRSTTSGAGFLVFFLPFFFPSSQRGTRSNAPTQPQTRQEVPRQKISLRVFFFSLFTIVLLFFRLFLRKEKKRHKEGFLRKIPPIVFVFSLFGLGFLFTLLSYG